MCIRDRPVIVLVERGRQDEVMQAYRAGADMCLVKPFSRAEFIELIQFTRRFRR